MIASPMISSKIIHQGKITICSHFGFNSPASGRETSFSPRGFTEVTDSFVDSFALEIVESVGLTGFVEETEYATTPGVDEVFSVTVKYFVRFSSLSSEVFSSW